MSWMEGIDLARYVMGALFAITLPPAIAYWFIVHPFVGFWRRVGTRVTFWFLGIFYLVTIAGLYPLRHVLLGRDLGTSLPAIAAAVPLIVVASVVSRKRRRHLTFQILAGVPELAPDQPGAGLLTEGIYGSIRHPRYVEFTLGLMGWSLVINYAGLYLITALCILALYVIVLIEERELRARFGPAYADYSARVPRFIPRRRS